MGQPRRAFVVDDDALVRKMVCRGLSEAGYAAVAGTADGDLGPVIETFEPDVIVARLDGTPAERVQLLRHGTRIPLILLVSADAPPSQRVEAQRAGADSVFIEPIHVDELVARVDCLMEHRQCPRVLAALDVTIDRDAHIVRRNGVELRLTPTEYNLLLYLATNVGIVLSKQKLLDRVWGFDEYDINVVEVHISSLRRKLEGAGPRLIQTVRGFGYVMRQADTSSAHERQPSSVPASGGSHPLLRRTAG